MPRAAPFQLRVVPPDATYAVILFAWRSVSGPCIVNKRALSYQEVASANSKASLVEETFIIVAEASIE